MSTWLDRHLHWVGGPSDECRTQIGDWIRVTWMDGQPTAEVIDHSEEGWPIIEHPLLPGLVPLTVDVFDVVQRKDAAELFVGEGL